MIANLKVGLLLWENIDLDTNLDISNFVKEEIAESDRPELTAADIVISGGRGNAKW